MLKKITRKKETIIKWYANTAMRYISNKTVMLFHAITVPQFIKLTFIASYSFKFILKKDIASVYRRPVTNQLLTFIYK